MEVKQPIRQLSDIFPSVPSLSDENASNTVERTPHADIPFQQTLSSEHSSSPLQDVTSKWNAFPGNRRRRLSAPLQDLTHHSSFKNGESTVRFEKVATKPSRQSLCHIPLSIIVKDQSTLMKQNSRLTGEVLNLDIAPRAPKRSRNNLNPEELPNSNTMLLEDSPFVYIPPSQLDSMAITLQHAQSLVHSYTSNEAKSAKKDIEELTGYVLSSPTVDPLLPYQAPDKAAIYQRLGPQLKQMDEYKSNQSRLAEKILDARGEKGRGGMKYFCLSNGQRISSAEYEKRYRVMLEEVHKVQSHAWKDYFQNLNSCSEQLRSSSESISRAPHQSGADETQPRFSLGTPHQTVTLPCRDKISHDPEIAKAEAVLWKTIDQALATYSETVLEIAKRKHIPAA
ncbi:hypothetical protein FisN_3Lh034 [Fistulifera solaris]|uniref:Uncharacterized protein n=1 Tax=Fistulifera solaris TaxID=1519565 RepID=A0A1Z5JYJ6_FISSO|nr:hypothetical protein FisN_3Lh034 [Fistulifera solaris]|eukprot:GAX19097.1 hypothetical protein FisN_3Lh034 [Fistulifera solaris]